MGRVDAAVTRRELEKRFREFLARAGLPRPQSTPTCTWPPAGSRSTACGAGSASRSSSTVAPRTTHAAFESDRLRDRALQAAGYRVMRMTWRQLHDAPAAVAADLRALLAVQPR